MKESVSRLRVALTSDCDLRCRYCFIDKERGETLDATKTRRILEQTIGSSGGTKWLDIYGGEPLAHFPIVREIVRSARAISRQRRKNLRISLASNALMLKREHLVFFREHSIQLCVSVDGESNDKLRVRRNGTGTLPELLPRLRMALDRLPKLQIMSLTAVHPQNVDSLHKNVLYLAGLGLRNVNFEMIQGIRWEASHLRQFVKGFHQVAATILRQIDGSAPPLFLHSVNRALAVLTGRLEEAKTWVLYPSGKHGEIPYPFLHISESASAGAKRQDGLAMLEVRDKLSRIMAQDLLVLSAADRRVNRYVKKAVSLGLSS